MCAYANHAPRSETWETHDRSIPVCASHELPNASLLPPYGKSISAQSQNELRCGIDAQENLAQAATMVPDGYWPGFDFAPAREEMKSYERA